MMKSILVILFVFMTSNALAQRHVPGGGPVGSPGNPGTGHPGGYNPGNGGYHPPVNYPNHGTHVPGGGPQGPRGPVIVVQPYPNYPTPSYPNPGNTYPSPSNYPIGPCTINLQYSGNTQYYTVYDGYNRYISSHYDYYQALNIAEQYDRMGYCHGIRNNTGNSPYPNPYPTPNPYPQTFCTVMYGQDAYGRQFYRVLDRAGRIIYTSPSYQQALQVSQTDARCFQYNAE